MRGGEPKRVAAKPFALKRGGRRNRCSHRRDGRSDRRNGRRCGSRQSCSCGRARCGRCSGGNRCCIGNGCGGGCGSGSRHGGGKREGGLHHAHRDDDGAALGLGAQDDDAALLQTARKGEGQIGFQGAAHVDGKRGTRSGVSGRPGEQIGSGRRVQVDRACRKRGRSACHCRGGRWNDGRASQQLQRARSGFGGRLGIDDANGQVAPVEHNWSSSGGVFEQFDSHNALKSGVRRRAVSATATTGNQQERWQSQQRSAREQAPQSARRSHMSCGALATGVRFEKCAMFGSSNTRANACCDQTKRRAASDGSQVGGDANAEKGRHPQRRFAPATKTPKEESTLKTHSLRKAAGSLELEKAAVEGHRC